MLNVLIVDDEPLAHEVLVHLCRHHGDLNIVAHCHSAAEVLTTLEIHTVDLMFLDIQMPRFSGLDLLRGLAAAPLTVIVSAHREHAIDGFELDVIDYLLKPVSAARFAEAIDKVRRRLDAGSSGGERAPQDVVLKVDRALRRFVLDEITSFQAQGNFVLVSGLLGSALATTTLKALRQALPASAFVQVHKSYIVRRAAIVTQTSQRLHLIDGTIVPIGRNFRQPNYLKGEAKAPVR